MQLRVRLEDAAQRMKIRKNTIITQALEQYLNKVNRSQFLAEARRQSMLASSNPAENEDVWSDHGDTTGWK